MAEPEGFIPDAPEGFVPDQQGDTTGLAVTHGILRGGISVSAGMATAAAGDATGLNEAVSAATGPFFPLTMAGMNILEFLGGSLLADRGVKTGEKALSQYSTTMRSLQEASKEHPLADQIGSQIPMLPFGLRSIKGYAHIVNEAEDATAAVKAVTMRAGGGALAGAGLEAVRPHLDNAINQVGQQMGFSPDEVEQPTIKSFIENAAMGAALNGAFVHKEGLGDASAIREPESATIGEATSKPEVSPEKVTTVAPEITNLNNAIDDVVHYSTAQLETDAPTQAPFVGAFGAGKRLIKSGFERIVGAWSGESQLADFAAKRYGETIRKIVPDRARREAIYNWADADGNIERLKQAAEEAPADLKKGYEDALTLTAHEKAVGNSIVTGYKKFFDVAKDKGLLKEALDNYLKRVVTKRPTGVEEEAMTAHLRDPQLLTNLPEARKRYWESMQDAERTGIRYDKDIAGASLYAQNMGRSITNNRMIERMFQAIDEEKNLPVVIHEGTGTPVENGNGKGLLVSGSTGARPPGVVELSGKLMAENKGWSPEKAEAIAKSRILNEYTKVPGVHQLNDWQYARTLEDGTTVLVKGDALVLKKHAKWFENKFRNDRNALLDKFLRVQSFVKGSKLGLSLFHEVHTRGLAAGHLTNPAEWRSMDELLKLPEIQAALRNGAQFVSSAHEGALLSEAMAAHGWLEAIPGIGDLFKAYKDGLFEDRIPRMKMEMYLNALERNRKGGISGLRGTQKLNEEQLATLTAKQANATFGEQNYRTMGAGGGMIGDMVSNPKFWRAMQIAFLAPDFGASKLQHIGQAFTRFGGEQRMALGVVAASLYTTARMLNKWLDDDYHWDMKDAFSVVVGDRRYSIRSLPGDMSHLFTSPTSFVYHRLSPLASTALEGLYKRDFRGRPVSWSDQVKDLLLQPVPIPLASGAEKVYDEVTGKPVPRYSFKDGLASAIGLSPGLYIYDSEVKQLANKWKQGTGNPKLQAEVERAQQSIYPTSDYLNMRDALANGDVDAARKEFARLVKLKGNGQTSVGSQKVSEAMRRWETGAFTGSKATERQFVKSLTPEQKKLYDEAIAERKRVYTEFQNMRKTTTRTILDAMTGDKKPFSIRDFVPDQ